MAKYGSDQVAFLLIDGYSLLGTVTQFSDGKEALTEETHTLGDAWVENEPVGLKKAELSQSGFYDDASLASNAALVTGYGVSRVACYGVAGNVKGRKMTGFQGAMQTTFKRVMTRGELHKCDASYLGNGQVDEGVLLHEHAAETSATGNTEASSVDNAASSAAGAIGYLQVSALALGGYTNVVVKVRHSADNVTFADLITFTAVTAAPAAERATVAGTINRYTAASWAFGGAGSGQSVTFAVGLARG